MQIKQKLGYIIGDFYFISTFDQYMYPLRRDCLMHNKDPKFMKEVIDVTHVQIEQ